MLSLGTLDSTHYRIRISLSFYILIAHLIKYIKTHNTENRNRPLLIGFNLIKHFTAYNYSHISLTLD